MKKTRGYLKGSKLTKACVHRPMMHIRDAKGDDLYVCGGIIDMELAGIAEKCKQCGAWEGKFTDI